MNHVQYHTAVYGLDFTALHPEMRDHTRVSLERERSREESRLEGSCRDLFIRNKRKEKEVLAHPGRSKPDLDPTSWEGGALNSLALYPWHQIRPPIKMRRDHQISTETLHSWVNKMKKTEVYLHSQICFKIVFLKSWHQEKNDLWPD